MKWLTTAFLCVLAVPALAQEQDSNLIPFPSVMLCAPYNSGERLKEQYGEIPFVEGDASVLSPEPGKAYPGKVRIFLDPNDFSYTILFDIQGTLSCLLTTGDNLQPIVDGDGI